MSDQSKTERFPAIHRCLVDSHGNLPETVTRWTGPQFAELRHAEFLDEVLTWAEPILRFPSVRKKLRIEGEFWPTYSHLRLAWWFAQCGIGVQELEPPTVGNKKADIRCKVVDTRMDLEVISPMPSTDAHRHVGVPLDRLSEALNKENVARVDVRLNHGLQASFREITEEKAKRIAKEVASAIIGGLPHDDEGIMLRFDDVTVYHLSSPSLLDEFLPSDEPLRIQVVLRDDESGSLQHASDVMAFLKRPRPGPSEDEGDVDWLTHTLRKEAAHFSPPTINGIWIEGTHDGDLFAQLVAPWGLEQRAKEFWESPQGRHVDFIGLFELCPGLPFPLPRIQDIGELMINPNGKLMNKTSRVRAELVHFWETWTARAADYRLPS